MVEYGTFALYQKSIKKTPNCYKSEVNGHCNLISRQNTGSVSTAHIYQLNSGFDFLRSLDKVAFIKYYSCLSWHVFETSDETHTLLADQKSRRNNGLTYNCK